MRVPPVSRAFVALAVATMLFFVAAPNAFAHGMRTGSLRIDQVSATRSVVRWSTTVPRSNVMPSLPDDCQATTLGGGDEAAETQTVLSLECPGGLAGRTLGVANLGEIVNEATVFVRFADGHTTSHLLTVTEPTWQLPQTQGVVDVARSYVRSGLVHIATGFDHLLFLVLLVLVLRTPRAVLLAETAFTLSHSLAFSATALGVVHVGAAPAEACIALSLVLLALDVRPGVVNPDRRAARKGALVALVFGLVHGLGFAGGLRETGLPDQHVAVALVGFGLGVELGQVAFLLLVLGVVTWASKTRLFPTVVASSTVAIGGLASAWFVERLFVALAA